MITMKELIESLNINYYYHKCSVTGLILLIQEFEPNTISISTDKSHSLFWRECCIVFNTKGIKFLSYSETDSDSRQYSNYDEGRIKFNSKKDLLKAIKYIILPKRTINTIKKGNYKSVEPISFTNTEGEEIKDIFNMFGNKLISTSDAIKLDKRWNKQFLNIK